MRFIYAKNSQYEFELTCNSDDESCRAPVIGGNYMLMHEDSSRYKCDEYRLSRDVGDWSTVCVDGVSKPLYP